MIPEGENIVETRDCPLSGKRFDVTDRDLKFYDQIAPTFGSNRYPFPAPVYAPEVRSQTRMAFRNERTFHQNTCSLTGDPILAMYAPEDGYKACKISVWRDEGWSPFDTGRDFDFDRPFFEQFEELYRDTPCMALYQSGTVENCEYTNWFGGKGGSKNCYLCTNGGHSEECMYMRGVVHCRDCFDMYYGTQDEKCYQCINVKESYELFFSQNCTGCKESSFLRNCIACTNCFGCINLTGKQYHIFNQPHSKEEYEEKMKALLLTQAGIRSIEKKVRDFFLTQPFRSNQNIGDDNCVGDYLFNCKDCFIAFEALECENGKYLDSTKFLKDSHDVLGYGYNADHLYQTVGVGEGSMNAFCVSGDVLSDSYYSMWVQSCSHLFGCVSLRLADHCVFNKSYGRAEYDELCGKIADHMRSTGAWGEFFPARTSPFCYNETVGNDFYPMIEDEVRLRGWRWREEKKDAQATSKGYERLEISQYDEGVVGKEKAQENIQSCLRGSIVCRQSGKPFRIQPRELAFYIQHDLPLPDLHPTVRHQQRVDQINRRELHERTCSSCQVALRSIYSEEQPEKVVCDECYKKEVF